MSWLTSLLLMMLNACCCLALVAGPNVCSRKEAYVVTQRVREKKPVTTKAYTWCFKMPPRCTKFKVEMVDHYKVQSDTRIRWVNECCAGYTQDEKGSECVPLCSDCVHGTCDKPSHCSCQPGYVGSACDVPCGTGLWGAGCGRHCSCLHSAGCDSETGRCLCPPGWRGDRCELACPSGSYGEGCLQLCSCEGNNTCDHVTGSCDFYTSCNGSTACRSDWTPSKPEMISKLLNPQSQPLVTSDTQDVGENLPYTHFASNTSEDLFAKNNTLTENLLPKNYTPAEDLLTRNFTPAEDFLAKNFTAAEDLLPKNFTPAEDLLPKNFTPAEDLLPKNFTSAEDNSEAIVPTTTTIPIPEIVDYSTTEDHPLVVTTVAPPNTTDHRALSFEDESHEEQLDRARQEQSTEAITESVVTIKQTAIEKPEEQRKKTTETKKFKQKEKFKEVNPKSVKKSQEWVTPDVNTEVPMKDDEETYYGQMSEEKPRKTTAAKRHHDSKDSSELALLKIARHSSSEKTDHTTDFLSSFSIAAGVSAAFILLAAVITLTARHRRAKQVPPPNEPAIKMSTIQSQTEAKEEVPLPVVRPLFFSPVYQPGDTLPTDGSTGLILTAVFSAPNTNIRDICQQQERLRESLSIHYDVPPPTTRCHECDCASAEHIYEELPCMRTLPSESDC